MCRSVSVSRSVQIVSYGLLMHDARSFRAVWHVCHMCNLYDETHTGTFDFVRRVATAVERTLNSLSVVFVVAIVFAVQLPQTLQLIVRDDICVDGDDADVQFDVLQFAIR